MLGYLSFLLYNLNMRKLVSVSEMKAIEKASDAAGHSYAKMMSKAGESLASIIAAHSHSVGKSILGLIGPGNNGGDALVALRLLAKGGWKASALIVGKRAKEDKLLGQAQKAGVRILASRKALEMAVARSGVVLDGLLGTGIRLPLKEPYSAVLAQVEAVIASRPKPPLVVAVDCPSGMDCESGQLAPQTLKTDLTITMAAVKRGMLTLPAFEYLGRLEVGDIGLPQVLAEWAAIRRLAIDEDLARSALPSRPLDAHKGTFGTALIAAGSQRFPGAVLLAGESAYRSGTGLVTLAAPKGLQTALAAGLPEATWLPLPQEYGSISASAAELVSQNLDRATAMLLGPGFGQDAGPGKFLLQLLEAPLPPLVVDADGLKLLAGIEDWQRRLPEGSVLTPHPGEMAILTGLTIEKIQARRIEYAEEYAQAWKQIVVLKGAFTVVAAPDGRTGVLPLVSPALARAGTGDVLAGLITGLRAQGVAGFDAACAAVWLHGQAGLRAAARLGGTAGVLAGDLISEIPALIAK
ncbi:MAG TPA: NAD(P)H-hydrate dehydratase [Anaerolineales bacterium]